MPHRIVLAVSGHGFGHAVRAAEVARALIKRRVHVIVRSAAPRWLFPDECEYIPGPGLDVGVVQHDGLDFDIDETRRQWNLLISDFEARVEVEAGMLKAHAATAVVADIPPLALAAAHEAGVPSFAVANFTWDWIYAPWPGFRPIVEHIRAAYYRAGLLFRLPLHSEDADAFVSFKRIVDAPLIARRAARSRSMVRAELGLADDERVVLISFGGFTARGLDFGGLSRSSNYRFVLTPPISLEHTALPANVLALNETPADYVSLLNACDVVVTKPGYGVVADCLANHVAVLFTDRGPFREYEVLAAALPVLGRARYISRADLMDGYLGAHLDALLQLQTPWTTQPMNGADVIADRVVQNLSNE